MVESSIQGVLMGFSQLCDHLSSTKKKDTSSHLHGSYLYSSFSRKCCPTHLCLPLPLVLLFLL